MKSKSFLITLLHNMKAAPGLPRAVLVVLAGIALVTTGAAQQMDSSAFDHQYNGDVYPVPGYTETPPTNWIAAPSSDGDILSYQNEIVESPYWLSSEWLGGPNPVVNANGWTIEVRVRIRDDAPEDPDFGAFNVFAKDLSGNSSQGRRVGIRLGRGYTTISSLGSGNVFPADNTNSFHVYRFGQVASSSTMMLWRDGVLLYTGVSRTSNDSSSLGAQLWWGDGSVGTGGPTIDVDYVRWDSTGLYEPVVLAPTVAASPQSSTNAVGDSVTFTAVFSNVVTAVQWYKNDVPIDSATTYSQVSAGQLSAYSIPSVQPSDEGSYYCQGSNGAGLTNTATAYLDVLADVTSPTVVSRAVSPWGKRVRVRFSEIMDLVSAGEPTNYAFQDGALAVSSVTVVDPFHVDVFTTTAPAPGLDYVLLISGVQDTSGNSIAANTPVAFTVDTNFPARANLIMAFNENSAVTNASGGVDWMDLSGAENHATNPNALPNRRPTLVPNALLDHGIFNFAPTSADVVTLRVPFTGSLGLDQNNYTWFAVARCSNLGIGSSGALTPFGTTIIRFQPTTADTFWLAEIGSTFFNGEPDARNEPLSEYQKAVYAFGRDETGSQVSAWSYPIANDQWYIIGGHADPARIVSAVLDPATNRLMAQTNETVQVWVGTIPPDSVWFGSYGDNRYRFGGDMAEVLLYTGDLGAGGFDEVMNYLRVKYFPPSLGVRPNGANIEVRFTGVLQSSTNVAGSYSDVPGNPTSPYVITPGNQSSQQYFRARQ